MTLAHQRGAQLYSRTNVPLGGANPFILGFNGRWFSRDTLLMPG
jgi:hypothetical protein